MRISGIQNFISNNTNKVNQNSNNSINSSSKNNLERSPMQDIVNFKGYENDKPSSKEFASQCVRWKFFDAGLPGDECPLEDCIYLKVVPAENTLYDYKKGTCALRLSTAEELRKEQHCYTSNPNDYVETMEKRMEDFRTNKGLKKGWENKLETLEDFQNAVELAKYLTQEKYFSTTSEDTEIDRPFGIPGL